MQTNNFILLLFILLFSSSLCQVLPDNGYLPTITIGESKQITEYEIKTGRGPKIIEVSHVFKKHEEIKVIVEGGGITLPTKSIQTGMKK